MRLSRVLGSMNRDITYLSRTFPSQQVIVRTWTFSCWLKRGTIGQNSFIVEFKRFG